MPNMDGTGPDGKGPRTGRGLGNCKPSNDSVIESGPGMRRNAGRGNGRGRANGRNRN